MYQVKLAGSHKKFAHHFEILNWTIELFPELCQEDEEADSCAVLDTNDADQGEPPASLPVGLLSDGGVRVPALAAVLRLPLLHHQPAET